MWLRKTIRRSQKTIKRLASGGCRFATSVGTGVNLQVFQTFETDAVVTAGTRPRSITYYCRCPEQRKHPDNFTTRPHIKKPKEEEITVIVNTAEDTWVSGNLVCPDIDTVLYLFADTIDAEKWWGIRDDTFTTNDSLKRAGHPEIMRIGDTDRATHIMRSDLIRKGSTPTEAIRELARSSGIRASILPMTDHPVATHITTPGCEMHFQEYWITHGGDPDVLGVNI